MTLRPELLEQLKKYNDERDHHKSKRLKVLKTELDEDGKGCEVCPSKNGTGLSGLPSLFYRLPPEAKDFERVQGITKRAKANLLKLGSYSGLSLTNKEIQYAEAMAKKIKDKNKCLRRAKAAYLNNKKYIFEVFKKRYLELEGITK